MKERRPYRERRILAAARSLQSGVRGHVGAAKVEGACRTIHCRAGSATAYGCRFARRSPATRPALPSGGAAPGWRGADGGAGYWRVGQPALPFGQPFRVARLRTAWPRKQIRSSRNIITLPNNAMKLTRGTLERERGVVTGSRHGAAGFENLRRSARPSQLIATVRPTGVR